METLFYAIATLTAGWIVGMSIVSFVDFLRDMKNKRDR